MFNKSYTIGRVFGIPIKIHSSLIIFLVLIGLYFKLAPFDLIFLAIGVFGSVALHELGHSWVAMKKGSYVHEIVLSPLGGAAKMMNMPSRPMDEIQVALAGPAVSLLLALIFWPSEMFRPVAYFNTMLFLFNVLPVFPMDGGRVLRAVLSMKRGRLTGTRIAATVGKYFCIVFVVIGLLDLNRVMLAVIGFYIYRAGQFELRMVQQEYQANPMRGQRVDRIDVDVSPPPYEVQPKWKFWK